MTSSRSPAPPSSPWPPALEIEAATRERERLARDIHDGVLQVLAMVQRRASALGGEAAELGRMAGEQEVALRSLVSAAWCPSRGASEDAALGAVRLYGPSRNRTRTGTPGALSTCARCSPRTRARA